MNKRYYSLVQNGNEVDINIFGDITSWAYEPLGEVSAVNLSKQLEDLKDVSTINLHINSYGGEVAEGLAIYNTLKNHKAKVRTYCDGFACSIASVIFMAGDERIMSKASLLMIHNAWTFVQGNADELRKQADDLDKITSASINAYMEHVNINEKKLKKLMDNETWLTYQEALDMGFATSIGKETEEDKPSQSVKRKLINLILQAQDDETLIDENDDLEESNKQTPNNAVDEEDGIEDDIDFDLEDDEDGEENVDDQDEETAEEKAVEFFKAIIGGM